MSPEAANLVGFAGMACIVGAYAYVTQSKRPNPFGLHGTNLLGAALLALSLTVNMNLPSLVLEAVWAGVATWGLAKAFIARGRRA